MVEGIQDFSHPSDGPMMSSRFAVTVGLLALLWASLGGLPSAVAGSTTVPDPALERRLDHTLLFTTRPGDTLSGLARWIYGHSTWWARIRAADPALRDAGPDQVLP